MCGIAGILSPNPAALAPVEQMAESLRHRGPDDRGEWIDPDAGVAFAQTRLAVVDLSPAGKQPMLSPCGRLVLIFNGEIYNHQELRKELEAAGDHDWRGHSDTETLLRGFLRWGVEATLGRCVGMFAIALWDRSERVLTLVRDRLGEKPLYFGWSRRRFIFASELKAFAAAGEFDPGINRTALDQFVRRLYVPSPFSIYEDVFKLLPGALLRVSIDAANALPSGFNGLPVSLPGIELARYWRYREIADDAQEKAICDTSSAIKQLEQLLVRSVAEQSIADVPVGIFLSGGYDSSMIAAIQQAHGGCRVETFTVGFDEAPFDESIHARAVAKYLGTIHNEFRVTAADALALVPDLPRIYDEPFADSSQIPMHVLSQAARMRVTVALSGDGGDELFGGYDRYRSIRKVAAILGRLPASMRSRAAAMIETLDPAHIEGLVHLVKAERWMKGTSNRVQRMADLLRCRDLSAIYSVLMSQWNVSADVVRGAATSAWPEQDVSNSQDPAAQMMQWDILSYLPDELLCKVDRAAMATSLETRAPFLDHRVVEFACQIPVSMKLGPEGGKWLLRQLLYKYVPRVLVDRPKAGFSIPLGQWLRGPLRDWAEGLLDVSELSQEGYFNMEVVRRHWDVHSRGDRDYSAALWPILMFGAWLSHSAKSLASGDLTKHLAA